MDSSNDDGFMTRIRTRLIRWICPALIVCLTPAITDGDETPKNIYSQMDRASRDGIGKVFLGREISHVMGHLGAAWLERSSRELEERPMTLVRSLGLKPGMNVADIGAGSGYFTRRIAPLIGPEGKVYAVDIQQEMLDILSEKLKSYDIENVVPVLGTIDDPKLPENSIDVAIMVDVYHEFSHPWEMIQGMKKSLKPGGMIVWVEYRKEDPLVPIKELHKMSREQVDKEAQFSGLTFDHSFDDLPRQHVLFYKKAESPAAGESATEEESIDGTADTKPKP